MIYNVIYSEQAEEQLDNIVNYIVHKLKNKEAAKSVLDDADATKERLSSMAPVMKLKTPQIQHFSGFAVYLFWISK